MHRVTLEFQCRDYVTVTMLGVGYRGRVNRVFIESRGDQPEHHLYEVQFANDSAELKMLTFRGDELKLTEAPAAPVGFT